MVLRLDDPERSAVTLRYLEGLWLEPGPDAQGLAGAQPHDARPADEIPTSSGDRSKRVWPKCPIRFIAVMMWFESTTAASLTEKHCGPAPYCHAWRRGILPHSGIRCRCQAADRTEGVEPAASARAFTFFCEVPSAMQHPSIWRTVNGALPALSLPLLLCAPAAGLSRQTAESIDLENSISVPYSDHPEARPSALDAATLRSIEAQDAADLLQFPNFERAQEPGSHGELDRVASIAKRRLQHVLVDSTAVAGEVWAAGQGWKASFDAAGMTFIPRFGRSAPKNYPTSFTLERVTLGGEPISFKAAALASTSDKVVLDRGAVREVYHLGLEAIEQTFVFAELKGQGDLVVQVSVETELQVIASADSIRFVDERFGEVHYGRAYAVDATGHKVEIERAWTGSEIVLTVPAAFVAEAALPLTIDPPLGTRFTNGFGTTDDDSEPDAAWDSATSLYWFSWEDYTSATDRDVFVSSISTSGVQGTTVAVDLTPTYWATPSIAANPSRATVFVVASVTTDGPGTSVAGIEGRVLSTTTGLFGSSAFVIDQTAFDCVLPDVGGGRTAFGNIADYCVVWQRTLSPTNSYIQARTVQSNGTFLAAALHVTTSSNDDDRAPVISKSRGDELFVGDFWNIAWIRNGNPSGYGTPYYHRVYRDGTFSGATEKLAYNTALARNLDITSTFDLGVPGTLERPFVVVFERNINNGDIYAVTCAQSGPLGYDNVSLLEDFDQSLRSSHPSAATDGTSLFLTFQEDYWLGVDDTDIYALSGNLAYQQGTASLALSERHARLDFSLGVQQHPVVTSCWDGGRMTDDALILWEDTVGATVATIRMQQFDSNTLDGSTEQAIGRQYCDANAHADSQDGGRRSSFIWATGMASVGSLQTLRCDEMRLNSFAYFIVSTGTGNVNHPGGSRGRLCLSGTIGRRVGGLIPSSGGSGSISVPLDPSFIPTPNGSFAAAPGQTLYFQCWHRDTIGPFATSNFSNACAITFLP